MALESENKQLRKELHRAKQERDILKKAAAYFTASAPDQKYVGDITYIWTQEGWLYLATVIDRYSRKIVGWSMQGHMRVDLANDALLMAIWQRKPRRGS